MGKGIGNYIHSSWLGFKTYGINLPNEQKEDGIKEARSVFNQQLNSIKTGKALTGSGIKVNKKQIAEIEQQLNYWYNFQKGDIQNIGNLNAENFRAVELAFQRYFGLSLRKALALVDSQNASIDFNPNALRALIQKNEKESNNILDCIDEYAKRKVGQQSTAKRQYIEMSAINNRIETLNQIRSLLKNNTDFATISKTIDKLNSQWQSLQKELHLPSVSTATKIIRKKNKNFTSFVNELNETIREFTLTKNVSLQGDYAEALAVAMSYIARNEGIAKGVDLVKGLVKEFETQIKGRDRVVKGIFNVNFDTNFIDLEKIIGKTAYGKRTSKIKDVGQISVTKVQDKVDIIYTVNNIQIPASVKNYNIGSSLKGDIHFHKGTSLLQMIQQYQEFTNYYLNIVAEHPDGSPDAFTFETAQLAMKSTMLLHALKGGFKIYDGEIGQAGTSSIAEILIVNDNFGKYGNFKVYIIDELLNTIMNNIEYLSGAKFGGFDKLKFPLYNKRIGKENSLTDAQQRINKLLAKLHSLSLTISLPKTVFRS